MKKREIEKAVGQILTKSFKNGNFHKELSNNELNDTREKIGLTIQMIESISPNELLSININGEGILEIPVSELLIILINISNELANTISKINNLIESDIEIYCNLIQLNFIHSSIDADITNNGNEVIIDITDKKTIENFYNKDELFDVQKMHINLWVATVKQTLEATRKMAIKGDNKVMYKELIIENRELKCYFFLNNIFICTKYIF